jgi:hypothetical protein
MTRRHHIRLAGLAGLAAAAAIPGGAGAAPFVLTQQSGIVREVVRGGEWAAWTRCVTQSGPTEVWARRFGTKEVVQLPSLTVAGTCGGVSLHGIAGSTVIASTPDASGARRLAAVGITTAAERVLDRDTSDATGARIVAADAYGPLVAWGRDVTLSGQRYSEVLTADLRQPPTTPAIVVRRQTHTGGGRLTGVWRGGSGEVMWRQVIPGGAYAAYSTGEQKLVRRRADGTLQTISQVTGPVQIAQADLDRGFAIYSLIRDDSNAAWIYTRDLTSNVKRLVRVAPSAVRPKIRLGPDMPAPKVSGTRAAWRERERLRNRTFRDLIRGEQLLTERLRVLGSVGDRVDQRVFQSAPDVYGRFATWAIVRFDGPTGWAGGYSGLAARAATSQIVVATLP